jgi:hypothetical protein
MRGGFVRGKRLSVFLASLGVAVAVGPFAVAAPPETAPVPFQQSFPGYTGVCDFPITVTFDTEQTERDWIDADGDVVRTHVTGKGTVTVTNDTNQQSVTVGASGPTLSARGTSRGTGHWVLIGRTVDADVLPFPPGAWLYTGRIADLDAADYSQGFRGRIVDLCAAVA